MAVLLFMLRLISRPLQSIYCLIKLKDYSLLAKQVVPTAFIEGPVIILKA
jgi:hypothetical protein